MSDSVGVRVRSGVKLAFISTVISGLIQAVLLVVLARLLGPADYGQYAGALAVATVTVGLVNGVLERSLIIHVGEQAPSGVTAAIASILSVFAAALVLAGTIVVTVLTEWQMSTSLMGALLFSQILNSFAIVPRVILRRKLLFGRVVLAEVVAQLAGGAIVSVALAAVGWGAFGLAVAQVVGSAVMLIVLAKGVGLRFARFTKRQATDHIADAISIGRVAALEMANGQLPPLMLTFMAGSIGLGLFNRAYTLVQLPVQLLTNSMTRVMISALVSVGDDKERLRSGMRQLVTCASAIVSPVAFGIAGSSEAFTAVLLGPRWAAAASLMPALALGTWTAMMGYLFSVLSEATRHFPAKIRVQVTSSTVLVLGLLLYLIMGLIGAAIGMAMAGCVFLMLYVRLGVQILDLPYRTVLSWLVPGLFAGLLCGGASWLIGEALDVQSYLVLIAQIVACGILSLIFYRVFNQALLQALVEAGVPTSLSRYLHRLL